MPLMGSSRALGFMTRMRTSNRCEKMSALCTLSDTTESFGASNLNVEQPVAQASSAATNSQRTPRASVSGMAMRQHVGGDQHHALLGDEEFFRVLDGVVTDTGPAGQLAVLIDD